MSVFAVSYVDYDRDGNEWLQLKGVYDNIDLCHSYINSKRNNDNITLFHQHGLNERDALDIVYNHNFRNNPKCDYMIEEITLNQAY
jgi:hypothetical protein